VLAKGTIKTMNLMKAIKIVFTGNEESDDYYEEDMLSSPQHCISCCLAET